MTSDHSPESSALGINHAVEAQRAQGCRARLPWVRKTTSEFLNPIGVVAKALPRTPTQRIAFDVEHFRNPLRGKYPNSSPQMVKLLLTRT